MKKVAGAAAIAAVAGIAYKVYESHESGKQEKSGLRLHIEVLEGKDFLAKDHHLFKKDTSDPYIVFKQGHLAIKTTTKSHTTNPVWNETLEMGILNHDTLEIEIFDKDIVSDDALSHAKIDLHEVTDKPQGFDMKLHGEAGLFHSNHGHLFLRLWTTGTKD